jgi:hypothetical protein
VYSDGKAIGDVIMKKKSLITTLIIFCLSVSVVLANTVIKIIPGEEIFSKIGSARKESIKALIGDNQSSIAADEIIATIAGEEISKKYFEVRYNACKAMPEEYENPESAAWDSLKNEICERQFAKENGLLPTEKEIEEYVSYHRSGFEETEEGRAFAKAYANSLGMTEDEYWEYNRIYEAPIAVTRIKVEQYLEENGLEPLKYSELEVNILDKEYSPE